MSSLCLIYEITVYNSMQYAYTHVYYAENRLSNLLEMSIIWACVALQIYTESRPCHFTFYIRYMQWKP